MRLFTVLRAPLQSCLMAALLISIFSALPALADSPTQKALIFHASITEHNPSTPSVFLLPLGEPPWQPQTLLERSAEGTITSCDVLSVIDDKYALLRDSRRGIFVYDFPAEKLSDPLTIRRHSLVGYGLPQQLDNQTVAFFNRDTNGDFSATLLSVPSLRTCNISFGPPPEGFQAGLYHASISPDLRYLAGFMPEIPDESKDEKVWNTPWSLVVLGKFRSEPLVLDSGLFQGWSPMVSWWQGPHLEWISDHEVLYSGYIKANAQKRGQSFVRVADIYDSSIKDLDYEHSEPSLTSFTTRLRFYDVTVSDDRSKVTVKKPPTEQTRFTRLEDRATKLLTLRDTAAGKDIWVGKFALFGGHSPSPDNKLVAFTARQAIRDRKQDLFIYDTATGKTQKVFSGYYISQRRWLSK